MELVLSLFPGVDLLGRAFTETGFSVLRGPDLMLDERIEDFNVPDGHVDGIIGGPPCVNYSDANRHRDPDEGDRLVLEFLRIVDQASPEWFLMENVRRVPSVRIKGYTVQRLALTDAECGGRQKRLRHIQFGHWAGHIIRPMRDPTAVPKVNAVLGRNDKRSHADKMKDQGFDPRFRFASLTPSARSRAVGNGVSRSMGLTLARAVTTRSVVTDRDCICGCGQIVPPGNHSRQAGFACRKRMQRLRDGTGPRVLEFSR